MSTSPLSTLADAGLVQSRAYIDGEWIGSATEFPVYDPATGAQLTNVANLGKAETQRAIDAAQKAFGPWARKSAKERAAILMRWYQLQLEHADDLARLMTAEQGKPLAEAKGEVGYGASFVEWFAEEARRVYGETIPGPDPTKRYLTVRQPIGVCAAITPWNFPVAMITRKVAPAIAAGCTVVIKPAEQTPLSALALAVLAERAGMPPGVLNVVTADAQNSIAVGEVLCASDTVRHLSFTGSTEVGRILMRQCAPTIK
ncbi:MAG TPA: aldehyde dehydrogenase family protein, partial [Rhodocyclaceae bacterium]|nr:aldehyde dehydrogenase family protein [Rhodocyclaceae bacterium]